MYNCLNRCEFYDYLTYTANEVDKENLNEIEAMSLYFRTEILIK